jgi:hypothetical protein
MHLKHGAGEECQKYKGTDGTMNYDVFQRMKQKRLLLQILKIMPLMDRAFN